MYSYIPCYQLYFDPIKSIHQILLIVAADTHSVEVAACAQCHTQISHHMKQDNNDKTKELVDSAD